MGEIRQIADYQRAQAEPGDATDFRWTPRTRLAFILVAVALSWALLAAAAFGLARLIG